MTDPNEKEILFHLKHGCSFYPVCPICNAIRRLILAVGEWQGRAVRALDSPDSITLMHLLVKDIRDSDFGKEEK